MLNFTVQDMSCGHCVRAITTAVKAVDDKAQLEFDLAKHSLRISLGAASAATLQEAISGAGYTPELTG
jgi:copper chaperone